MGFILVTRYGLFCSTCVCFYSCINGLPFQVCYVFINRHKHVAHDWFRVIFWMFLFNITAIRHSSSSCSYAADYSTHHVVKANRQADSVINKKTCSQHLHVNNTALSRKHICSHHSRCSCWSLFLCTRFCARWLVGWLVGWLRAHVGFYLYLCRSSRKWLLLLLKLTS